jgi:hypothetical protein
LRVGKVFILFCFLSSAAYFTRLAPGNRRRIPPAGNSAASRPIGVTDTYGIGLLLTLTILHLAEATTQRVLPRLIDAPAPGGPSEMRIAADHKRLVGTALKIGFEPLTAAGIKAGWRRYIGGRNIHRPVA